MAKLTDQFIRNLEKGVQVFDETLRGFGVRRLPSGHTHFFVKYSIGKQQRRLTLGPFVPGAISANRKEAALILAQAHAGIDVVGDRKRAQQEAKKASQVKTLGELVPVYLRVREFGNEFRRKLRPKSLIEATRYLEKAWLPLHCAHVDQITREMVEDRWEEIASISGGSSADLALATLSAFFGWAIKRKHFKGAKPTADIERRPKCKRTRVLSEEELVTIWQACDDDDFGRIVKLLMLTGQRRQEIGGLEWREIHAGRRQIELPEARTKNGKPHIIPLAPAALKLLEGLPSDCRYVFGRFMNWYPSKNRLDERIAERRGSTLAAWVLHDIRRSVVTHIAQLDFAQPHVIEAIVNHISGHKADVAGVYNLATYLPQKREALERWAAYITGQVTPLSSAKNSNPEISEQIDRQPADGTR